MADVDAPLGQQVLDLTERKREADLHHHDRSDHLRRAVEPSKRVVGFGHKARYPTRSGAQPVWADKTSWRDVVGINDSYLRRLVPLAFLAPDIQAAIMDGRQPVGLTLQSLRDRKIPMSWADQREQLGFQLD